MQPIEIIEIDQDFCAQTYGQGLCEAQLGVTGAHKCFNTIGTCQFLQAYSNEVKTLRFCTNQQIVPINHLPFLDGVSTASAEINPGGANKSQSPLGKRSTISVNFIDAPSTDRMVDKYAEERRTGAAQETGIGYNPEEKSTFWRKWKARNKFYLYRPMRYITALIDDAGILHDVRTRHYVITGFSGPSANGKVSISGKDILELLARDKAEAPIVSVGKLPADIDEITTSITLTPAGIGAKYPAIGKVAIGKEICEFTRSDDDLTLVRGVMATVAEEHKEGDTVQICLEFDGADVKEITQTLLEDYANIDSQFLDLTGWQAEIDAGYLPHKFSAVIAKPEKALDLLSELMEQGYFYIWFDEIDNLIKMRAVRRVEVDEAIVELDHEVNFIADSISISDKPDQIITRVVVNYGMINPLENAKEGKNFSIAELIVDLENEDDDHARISNTKTIYSRWMHAGHGAAARDLGERLLDRYKVPPVAMSFSLAAKDADLKLADYARVKSPYQVGFIGDNALLDGQIIKASERKAQYQFDYVLQQFAFERAADAKIKNIEISDDVYNVNLLSLYNSVLSSPLNKGDTLNVTVRSGVVVGSQSTDLEALFIPDFGVEDLTIRLIISDGAYIVGRGGDAGGGITPSYNPTPSELKGGNGGNAIKTRMPIIVENSGTIGGGGGGGATIKMFVGLVASIGGGGAGQKGGKGARYIASREDLSITNSSDGYLTLGGDGGFLFAAIGEQLFNADTSRGGGLGEIGSTIINPPPFIVAGQGGQAGLAIDGESYITWEKQGIIKGARVN